MLTLLIIALVLSVAGCVIGIIALLRKPSYNVIKIEDIPFITIKDDIVDIDGRVEVRDGVYQL